MILFGPEKVVIHYTMIGEVHLMEKICLGWLKLAGGSGTRVML